MFKNGIVVFNRMMLVICVDFNFLVILFMFNMILCGSLLIFVIIFDLVG